MRAIYFPSGESAETETDEPMIMARPDRFTVLLVDGQKPILVKPEIPGLHDAIRTCERVGLQQVKEMLEWLLQDQSVGCQGRGPCRND